MTGTIADPVTLGATPQGPLSADLLRRMDAYWRAANYLSVGQLYFYDNPLLKRPLTLEDVKPLVVGHWGTTTGQNFIYVHLNRAITSHDLDMFYIAGPGHGGPALVANTYLEGSYSEIYPDVSQDEAGLKKLFTQFSFPGGISSHVAPTTPGSIHEGGELGYSLSQAQDRRQAGARHQIRVIEQCRDLVTDSHPADALLCAVNRSLDKIDSPAAEGHSVVTTRPSPKAQRWIRC